MVRIARGIRWAGKNDKWQPLFEVVHPREYRGDDPDPKTKVGACRVGIKPANECWSKKFQGPYEDQPQYPPK